MITCRPVSATYESICMEARTQGYRSERARTPQSLVVCDEIVKITLTNTISEEVRVIVNTPAYISVFMGGTSKYEVQLNGPNRAIHI